MDQKDTSFLKGRTLAINAAAQALTGAGFALPKPIYRLRFDDGAPLALKGMNVDAAPAHRPQPRMRPPVPAANEDTGPDTHIERLVEDERAATRKEDLLDSGRPIE